MLIEPQPSPDSAGAFDAWREQQTQAWGYVPNYAALFAGRGGMDRRRFELVTIAAARARASTYCTAAHAKFLRDVCDDEPSMQALASGSEDAALEPVDRDLVRFARLCATDPASIGESDVASLREHGLTDAEVADVIFAVAARCFFATVLDAGGAQADAALAATFDDATRDGLTVGRPFAEG